MPRAVVLHVDGTFEEIEQSLPALQQAVGGYIEIAPTPGAPFVMFCNEEGKIQGLPFNPRANLIANLYRDWEDPIVGDVVLVGPVNERGDNESLTLDDLRAILEQHTSVASFGIGQEAARHAEARGPFGTNEGDKWLGEGSPAQEHLDTHNQGLTLIHEMMVRDGELQEVVYVTQNRELIEEATLGTELYWAQKASEN